MEHVTAADLTEAEKVALTAGLDFWHLHGVPRLDIPSILVCDGPHGLRKQPESEGFGMVSVPATCFPTASALAATWDLALVEEVGVALGEEARAEGVSVLLGPGANIKRTVLCGRNFEYFSEDPNLSSRMAAAWIRGVQSTGVGASLKHFAANNQEWRRYTVDSVVDERALREIYLASFEFAVRTEKPATIMAAYNKLNGRYCTDNPRLLLEILRGEWGFDGVVVSDWGATNGRAASIASGMDLEMPGFAGAGDQEVAEALKTGALHPQQLERAADAMLGLIERTAKARVDGYLYEAQAHHDLARRTAAAGTVLLRNESVLPLANTGSVAVLGAFAKTPRYQGAGSSGITPHRIDNAYDSLVEQLGAERVHYADGYRRDSTEVDEALLAEARTTAERADTALVFIGLPEAYEVEGMDREHMDLPPAHNALVAAIAASHPRVVVVLANGARVAMPWRDDVAGIVEGYLGGQAGGGAIADVLTGRSEPGGRLAETFPHRLADNPTHAMPTGPSVVEYRESVYVGYRYYDSAGVDVAFPFGFGLSYTSFAWSDAAAEVGADGEVRVEVTVSNTGERAGSEVVQLYVHDVASTAFRPAHELKGFAKVHLAPGEEQRVTIPLSRDAFAFWDTRTSAWVVETGAFELRLGASSRDIRATLPVHIEGVGEGFDPGPKAYHGIGATTRFDRASFAQLCGPLKDNVVDAKRTYTMNTPIVDMRHPAARLLMRVMRKGAKHAFKDAKGTPVELMVMSMVEQTTPRMLPMMMLGKVSNEGARRFVDVANGRYGTVLRGLMRKRRRNG